MTRQTMGMMIQEKPAESVHLGRQWVRVAGTAISLNTAPAGGAAIPMGCREVLLQADPANGAVVAIGGWDCAVGPPAMGIQLLPGQAWPIAIDDVSKLFVNGGLNDAVIWLAVR